MKLMFSKKLKKFTVIQFILKDQNSRKESVTIRIINNLIREIITREKLTELQLSMQMNSMNLKRKLQMSNEKKVITQNKS